MISKKLKKNKSKYNSKNKSKIFINQSQCLLCIMDKERLATLLFDPPFHIMYTYTHTIADLTTWREARGSII